MSADFTTTMLVKGTIEELIAIIDIFQKYSNTSDVYLRFAKMAKQDTYGFPEQFKYLYEFSSDEEIKKFIWETDGQLWVQAGGPYGHYCFLDEVPLFEEVAEAAPNSEFEGEISGFTSGDNQRMWCELKDKKLRLYYKYEANDESPYYTYVSEKVSIKQFLDRFKLRLEYISNSEYAELIDEMLTISNRRLKGLYNIYRKDTDISYEEFKMEVGWVRSLGIKPYEDFMEENSKKADFENIYDPVEKKYIKKGSIV